MWYGMGLPITARVSRDVCLYTNPSVAIRAFNLVRIPVGMVVDFKNSGRIVFETGYTFGSLQRYGDPRAEALVYATLGTSGSF